MACNLKCGGGHNLKYPGGHKFGTFFISTNCKFSVSLKKYFLWCIKNENNGKMFRDAVYMDAHHLVRWKLTKNDKLYAQVQKLVRAHIHDCGWNCKLRETLSGREEESLRCMAQTEAEMLLKTDLDYQHFHGDYLLYLAEEMEKSVSYENFSIE